MKKITYFIVALAVITGIAGVYYYQKNIYSKEILKLEIIAPGEADLLGEVEYIVKYKNNGDTRLEEPELIFEYPKYSVPLEGDSLRVTKSSQDLGGAVYPGEEKILSFKARLLGKEGEAKIAKVTLSYRPKNLKARYQSETTTATIIKKVPLTFEFDLPSKIESGRELSFKINYFSSANYPLSDLRVMVDYPSNFEFTRSNPVALEQKEWDVGLLNKAEGGRIEISGNVRGEAGEEKVFQAKIGSWQDGEFVLIKEAARGINIIKPTLYITQQINNNPEYVANPGDNLHYEIFFRNIGESALTDLTLQVTLTGNAFDLDTLRVMDAEYQKGDNSMLWDWRRVGDLQLLPSQEEGSVEFWVRLKDNWEIKSVEDKNPTISTRIYVSQVREEFVNKVNSKLDFSQAAYFEDEVFGNSGPLPPRTGENTTYTIIWQAKNYYNEVKNAKVKAALPQNVRLTGKIFPEEEADKFTFDSKSRELVWSVGDLLVAQGVLNPAPNIAFQVSLYPAASDQNKIVELISQAQITGQDQWTEDIIAASDNSIDTTLPDDPTVTQEEGVVK